MKKLAIHLVVWNGAKYVPYLFESLRNQMFKDWSLLVIDNNSSDGTVKCIKKELQNFPAEWRLIENKDNLGFAAGHNQAFNQTESEYILLLNQDMMLMPDCLAKLINFMGGQLNAAAASPRLMKWNFNSANENEKKTDVIDSLGLKVFRNRRVVEKYSGKSWNLVKPKMLMSYRAEKIIGDGVAVQVFGVSGALPMFRREKLKEVLLNGQIFDESYHSYKEDVDLAYRLRQRGLDSYCVLDAVAYHDRSTSGSQDLSDTSAASNKGQQSDFVKYGSYKNHLMTLYKNEYWQCLTLDLPWILWYEIKKFIYYLLFDRAVLKGLVEVWRLRKSLKKSRSQIVRTRTVDWKTVRSWWV